MSNSVALVAHRANGQFTALLGSESDTGVTLQNLVKGSDDLSLQITVLNTLADDSDDVVLSNPQRLLVTL